MVVVEGVARYLDNRMNIWKVAQPVVEEYIKTYIGPRAAARDLARTARVLARFGPRLPAIVEAALVRQAQPEKLSARNPWPGRLVWGGGGLVAGAAILALVEALL